MQDKNTILKNYDLINSWLINLKILTKILILDKIYGNIQYISNGNFDYNFLDESLFFNKDSL